MEDKKLGQEPAFPTIEQSGNPEYWNTYAGISKRLYIATIAIQGILASPTLGDRLAKQFSGASNEETYGIVEKVAQIINVTNQELAEQVASQF
jgi:hypothetical protein